MMSAQNVKVEAQRVSLRYPGINGAPDFIALQETSFAVEEGHSSVSLVQAVAARHRS